MRWLIIALSVFLFFAPEIEAQTRTYNYHNAGYHRGRYYPAGYYYWNGNNWHMYGYGNHYGYSSKEYYYNQCYQMGPSFNPMNQPRSNPMGQPGPIPPQVGPMGEPIPPKIEPIPPPTGLDLTAEELLKLKELLKK